MDECAKSVPAELVEINEDLTALKNQLKTMEETDEYTVDEVLDILARLGEIDKLRTHDGRFLPAPIAQAYTLNMLFECFDLAGNLRMRRLSVDQPLLRVYQEILNFELRLTSIFNFERFSISVINLREFEDNLKQLRAESFGTPVFKTCSGASKLIICHHLARCHRFIRMLLLGVEDLSESLLALYEELVKAHFEARDAKYRAMRHDAGHKELNVIRRALDAVQATKKEGIYPGDTSDLELAGVPRGQTIINAMVEENYAEADVIEAWLTLL